jgi:hypothetical protein
MYCGKDMIIVRMLGGLGNQMFQHAVGTALARHHQCELRWDLAAYGRLSSQRPFELKRVFGLDLLEADESSLRLVLGWRGHPAVKTMFDHRYLTWARPKTYIAEPHFQYWPSLWSLHNSVYLDGYWQSEKYFKATSHSIHNAFAFSLPLSDRNQDLADKISACNSVSVHVRRGDYVSSPSTNQVHGCCSLEYYRQAAIRVLDQVIDAHFFVFSDDPEWVRANLALPASCTYIGHNQGATSYCDMQLMSMCQNHIIANSSFSWWGAWLSKAPDKLVIAPKQWFRRNLVDTSDLYCSEWVQL